MDGGAGELENQLNQDDEEKQFYPPGGSDEAVTQLVPDASGNEMKAEDDGQHQAPGDAPLQENAHIGPLKVGEDAPDDLIGCMERVGPEEDPEESHKRECQQP